MSELNTEDTNSSGGTGNATNGKKKTKIKSCWKASKMTSLTEQVFLKHYRKQENLPSMNIIR